MNRSELSHTAGAVDDSTINIVVVIIIIIIIIGFRILLYCIVQTRNELCKSWYAANLFAALQNIAVRRRRRRPNVGVAPAPFSWRVQVTLYTSYMLLDFCNAAYNESWTLTKNSKNDAGVFCNSPTL